MLFYRTAADTTGQLCPPVHQTPHGLGTGLRMWLNYKVILIWFQVEMLKPVLVCKQKKERKADLGFWKSKRALSGLKVAEENRNDHERSKKKEKKYSYKSTNDWEAMGFGIKSPRYCGTRQEKQPSGKNHKKVRLNLQTSEAPECIPVLPTSSITGVLNEGPGSLRKLTILCQTTSCNDCDILEHLQQEQL